MIDRVSSDDRAAGTAAGTVAAAADGASPGSPPSWRRQLAEAIRDPAELLRRLDLPDALLPGARGGHALFPTLVTEAFLARMRRGDPTDPLLRQVLPVADESVEHPGFGADPVGECAADIAPGLLQKYHGRALLVATGACAVHCRYCFRRHFPYQETPRSGAWWGPAVERCRTDPGLQEIILSGGDPLVLGNGQLQRICADFADLASIRRLRIHTRLPVVLPDRVDRGLCGLIRQLGLPVVVVIHANHAREIDAAVARAMADLRAAGAVLLNQAVLLAGINDTVAALADLGEALVGVGVTPYYLHQLDRVAGAAHFQVGDERAQELIADLRERVPGYLVPRLVREESGAPGKTPLG